MEELKALEILKNDKEELLAYKYHKILSHDGADKLKKTNEAIAELEALQAPKTCETCQECEALDLYMGKCDMLDQEVNLKWGCLSHDLKVQQ